MQNKKDSIISLITPQNVKIQNHLTGILRSPSLYHVETTSKQ
jgi:hypothetical protein